jgi:hypothetical protein
MQLSSDRKTYTHFTAMEYLIEQEEPAMEQAPEWLANALSGMDDEPATYESEENDQDLEHPLGFV